jgi:hypothetical protein
VCVPEECQPADLEGEQLREWLLQQHARIEGDNTATPTQLHYLQNLVEIGEVARSTWTGKSLYSLALLVSCLFHSRKLSSLALLIVRASDSIDSLAATPCWSECCCEGI